MFSALFVVIFNLSRFFLLGLVSFLFVTLSSGIMLSSMMFPLLWFSMLSRRFVSSVFFSGSLFEYFRPRFSNLRLYTSFRRVSLVCLSRYNFVVRCLMSSVSFSKIHRNAKKSDIPVGVGGLSIESLMLMFSFPQYKTSS